MCLDIDPDSVIHKHLVKKLYDLTENTADDEGYNSVLKSFNEWDGYSKHYLTELPSFHISLGVPTKCENTKTIIQDRYIDTAGIVGDITLAPICISKKDNKKSAWIPLHPYFYTQLHQQINEAFERNNYQPYELEEKDLPYKYLHISLANLTSNPHDSIARPEDCIIDTITA